MSYSVYITRKANSAVQRGPKITKEEWVIFVEGRSDLIWSSNQMDASGWRYAEMVDYGGKPSGILDWREGNIELERPTVEQIQRAIPIARGLNARVMDGDGNTYIDPNDGNSCRAAYYSPKNLTNEWEEPPEGHDEEHKKLWRTRLGLQDESSNKLNSGAKPRTLPINIIVLGAVILLIVINNLRKFLL